MRLTSSRAYSRPPPVPKMPSGLVELMDGLARDVLMHNPTNVYQFCANHMEKLLEIRDGPSRKKTLSLEQKIQTAQEKMRQKAQKRREMFDKEMKLKLDDATVDLVVIDTPVVTQELAVPGPSSRPTIHHEVDFKNASEVEISHGISHVEYVPLRDITNSSKIDESCTTENDDITNKTVAEVIDEGATDNLEKTKNRDAEIVSNDKHDLEIDEEPYKKVDEVPIFGKVKKEVTAEPLAQLKCEENNVTIDSSLQTITEVFEKPNVPSTVILPKITIGDDGRDPDSISDEPQQVIKLDVINELSNRDTVESNKEKSSEVEMKSETEVANNSNVLESNEMENAPIPELDKNKTDIIKNNENISDNITLLQNEKPNNVANDIYETIQKPNSPTLNELIQENPDEGNAQQIAAIVASNDCSSTVFTDETQNNNSSNLMIPPAHALDISDSRDRNSVNKTAHKDTIGHETLAKDLNEDSNVSKEKSVFDPKEIETNLKGETDGVHENITAENVFNLNVQTDIGHENITTENVNCIKAPADVEHITVATKNVANLNAETDVDHENMTKENIKPETDFEHVDKAEHHNAVSNTIPIDAGEIDPEIIQYALKVREENLDSNYTKLHDNTENSLQKSDSTENINEDSLSMVESDLSKADDDSTHNNPNMDLETAAVTIQKVFRSFMFKSRNSTFDDTTNEHNSLDEDNDKKEEYYAAANLNKERRPLGITRMDTVLQTVNEEKSLSLSTDDSSTLSSAATTIQAHVRGFLVRNRLNSSKTFSMNSLVNSHEILEADPEQHRNKTILNIHIVPEEGNYLSRDESLITSMDLSLDGSPPSSVNLHPLSCDISERRKMLKREDAVQSVSPPSNNSGKLSEDSVKEVLINENDILEKEPTDDKTIEINDPSKELDYESSDVISSASTVTPTTVITISKSEDPIRSPRHDTEVSLQRNGTSLTKLSSDESDVITPFFPSPRSSGEGTKLTHSGEFHDVVLPTKVSRSDTSAVRGE